MRIRKIAKSDRSKGKSLMTPMIDIVFLLLVFFIMTFQIVLPEGDFNVKMPQGSGGDPSELPPITVTLNADAEGELSGIALGDVPVRDFAELRRKVISLVGHDMTGPAAKASEAEVQFNCDFNLEYKHVIDAMTAVSGYIDENRRKVTVVEKIRFSQPHRRRS